MFLKLEGLVAVLFLCYVNSQESCTTKKGLAGSCINIKNCSAAMEDIKNKINPQICNFSGIDPIVCCASTAKATTAAPVLTTEYVPLVVNDSLAEFKDECEPLSADKTAPKTGHKAWDKCIDYQKQLIFPCESTLPGGEKNRVYRCNHGVKELIFRGEEATPREFPHMVLLGFGDNPDVAQYLCAGSIISEKFILTAAHSTHTRDYGKVTYVKLGAYKRTDQVAENKLYKIARIVKHPNYKPPAKYNDIALLETDRPMSLDEFAVPACLHRGDEVDVERANTIGWSVDGGPNANTMQNVVLSKFTTTECKTHFPVRRTLAQGIDEDTQLCYGDKRDVKDTCQGEGGDPLQVENQHIYCMYTIIGVASFGYACSFLEKPGVYTKVAPFVPWIESVVWP